MELVCRYQGCCWGCNRCPQASALAGTSITTVGVSMTMDEFVARLTSAVLRSARTVCLSACTTLSVSMRISRHWYAYAKIPLVPT